ncbi:MAG TPA: DUF4870 domain-containing protein [Candidatus Polarisedimenticolaceae bacterium]|nr:DUF4870 domain-containing protein [Candidatus Polarisedimenticolaceae bacterium]
MESQQLSQELSDQDRILLVFSYLGPLAVVSLVATRREFVKWHAKQGLVLSLSVAAIYLVILRPLIHFSIHLWSGLAELFWAIAWLVAIGGLLMMLMCIIRGLEGERFKLPFLGDLADRL